MSANSKIEWTDHTFNPWIGCTKVSPGCVNCYAEGESKRRGWAQWGKGKPRHRTSADYWKQPLKWNREFAQNLPPIADNGRRPRVFCASLADVFDDEVPFAWRSDLFDLIEATPNLDWLLLTKRPQNIGRMIAEIANPMCELWDCEGVAPSNIWLGVSVEDQDRADERIPLLLQIPAVVRFLSCEPLLGPVDLTRLRSPEDPLAWQDALSGCGMCDGMNEPAACNNVDWVIVGGESGPRARPCEVKWIRLIVSQCKTDRVAVFVKQLGQYVVTANDDGFEGDPGEWPMDTHFRELDSGYQGAPVRLLLNDRKGGDPSEWAEDLRIRQFPQTEAVAA